MCDFSYSVPPLDTAKAHGFGFVQILGMPELQWTVQGGRCHRRWWLTACVSSLAPRKGDTQSLCFYHLSCVHFLAFTASIQKKKINSCAKNIAFIFFHFVVLPHIRSHIFGDGCVPYGHHTASRTQRVEMDLWLSVHSMRWTDNSTSYALEILCDLFGSRGGWDFADGDMLSVMVDKGHLRATEQRHWPIWLMWHGESKRTLHWIPTGTGQMIYFFLYCGLQCKFVPENVPEMSVVTVRKLAGPNQCRMTFADLFHFD